MLDPGRAARLENVYRDNIYRDRHLTRETPMSVNVLYRTRATANGGRDGQARSEDGRFEAK